MNFDISPMKEDGVDIIVKWKYPLPYSMYNVEATPNIYEEFLSGEYFSVYDNANKLIGYYCFGVTAQVSCDNSMEYYKDTSFLDIGLAMNPELCGKGNGRKFVAELLEFAKSRFKKTKFRLTVATFNLRAITVYKYHKFKKLGKFSNGIRDFFIMIREEGYK